MGNRFRSLWGKEAGWAHSVLFTADLKAFAERLVVKKEVKEQVERAIKEEVEGTDVLETVDKENKVLVKKVKREAEEEKTLTDIEETVVRTSKRRRKA